MNIIKPPVHEGKLASYIGEDSLQLLIQSSLGTKVPIAVGGTPFFAVDGTVIPAPSDLQLGTTLQMMRRGWEGAIDPIAYKSGKPIWPIRGGGFTSLSDLINEATNGGKRQDLLFAKAGPTKVVGRGASLWGVGVFPAAGAAGGTTGTGAARTSATSGAIVQQNAAGGDTLHLIGATVNGNTALNMLLLYDRLWDMTHTMTVDPRSCDAVNVPTRYQTATTAPGNFLSAEVTTILPAATPTVTIDYVDQDGNNVTGPAMSTIESAAVVNTIPFTVPKWFYPLDNADQGLRSLQNSANAVNLSAAMASGVVTWFIGHPLMYIPIPSANTAVVIDGINSAFNLVRVFDSACLELIEMPTGQTTATTYWGTFSLCSG